MAVAAIMPPSMPSSKKRCWNLLVKDVRNNAQEAEVLSSFRKRYTSTRKLAFRPVADYAGGSTSTSNPPPPPTDNNDNTDNTTTTTTATTTITQGGRACIEIQFTGPQPIEGPAGLMCNLLQATFVSAHPVQLDRGRKRKTRPGGGGGGGGRPPSSLASSTPPLAETSEEDDDMVVSDDDICTAFGGAFGGEGGLILGEGGGGGGGSLSAPVPATTADFPASSASPPPCLGRSCSVMTAEGNDLPSIDEADASGDRLPAAAAAAPPPPFGARPASGDTDDPAPSSASCPGLARGTSYDECRAGFMSQEEAVSLFAATGAATAEAKPPASTAAAAAGDDQWERAPGDDPDGPFCPLALERHCSSTWALLDPTHAGAPAAAVTVAGEEGAPDHRRASIVPDPCLAAESSLEEQQQPTMWYGEGPHHPAVPAGGGLELPPAGDTIAFGWCEQECDFDGNYAARPSKTARVLPPTAATSFFPDPSAVAVAAVAAAAAAAACTSSPSSNSLNNRCRFAFLGLESEIRDFTVCARFSVDPASRVERFASLPLDGAAGGGGGGGGDPAGAVGGRRGRVDAAVEFPSIMEIWPEVYKVDNIRVMEVDMVVEVRSSDGNILYTGPTLKITYRRSAARTSAPTDAAAAAALMT
ncbi:hypothetical protein Esi_0011_0046 [Ectocarpus siliculosus]|uniref:Uncharacterized protein n=1 Tax=Ectocarpus siliculosus TaxID=2880 RepID=D8LCK7_ECTSI|nr:hypothetical protein Esi_0011_0046 [Ectocarpus siliculosus]|eukprot:CBN79520.1 hypothetical protein Esi_0011_0046 [Ectocarpus siliculosus]